MTSRTFISICLQGYLSVIRKLAESRQVEFISQPANNPFINNFFQISAAFLKGFAGSPDAFKFGNLSIIWLFIIYYFVFCLSRAAWIYWIRMITPVRTWYI